MVALLAPQSKVREKPSATGEKRAKYFEYHILHVHVVVRTRTTLFYSESSAEHGLDMASTHELRPPPMTMACAADRE